MNNLPFTLLPPLLTWTQIPSSIAPTISAKGAIGGAGIAGYGLMSSMAGIQGPGGTSANFPVPVATTLKGGTTGTAYSETITAQGGTSPYTYAVTSGALPTGTTMSSAGAISGTPSAVGAFSFTVTVTDSAGFTGSQAFAVVIAAPAASGGGSYPFVD